MTGLMKHTDDNGDLSVFASEEEVLFVCSNGHWWIVNASSTGVAPEATAKRALDGATPSHNTAAEKSVTALSERFGREVFKAMTFK